MSNEKGMAGFECVLKVGGVIVGAIRNLRRNTPMGTVEVTARDSEGWKDFVAGLNEIDLSGDLVRRKGGDAQNDVIRNANLNKTCLDDIEMGDAEGVGLVFDGFIVDYGESQDLEDAVVNEFTVKGTGKPRVRTSIS